MMVMVELCSTSHPFVGHFVSFGFVGCLGWLSSFRFVSFHIVSVVVLNQDIQIFTTISFRFVSLVVSSLSFCLPLSTCLSTSDLFRRHVLLLGRGLGLLRWRG